MGGDRRPTVAALIPVWNGAAYLAEAIESVVAERVDEVVVVDDGSTDDSGAIAERFGPPVRCLRQANRGVAAARNAALQAAFDLPYAEGYAARAFMHETDHCNGKLFIDHLPKMRRDMVVKRFKKEKTWK